MAALLVREAPAAVHDWLKQTAVENRRSLNQQIIVCLEWCMGQMPRPKPAFPMPVKLKGGALSLAELDAAKKAGRK